MSVQITVDGILLQVEAGTVLTAALVGSGRWKLRNHPVTGEPRGPMCGMGACLECEVQVDDQRDVRACLTTAREGMRVVTDSARTR